METLVYENFSIDWTPLSFGVASESENRYNATEGVQIPRKYRGKK